MKKTTKQNTILTMFKTEITGLQHQQAAGQLKGKSLYFIVVFMQFINGLTHSKEFIFLSSEFKHFLEFNGIKTQQQGVNYKVIYKDNF